MTHIVKFQNFVSKFSNLHIEIIFHSKSNLLFICSRNMLLRFKVKLTNRIWNLAFSACKLSFTKWKQNLYAEEFLLYRRKQIMTATRFVRRCEVLISVNEWNQVERSNRRVNNYNLSRKNPQRSFIAKNVTRMPWFDLEKKIIIQDVLL